MTFAEKLKAARERAGISQRELAEKAALTRDAVSSLEQGRRSPNWDTVQALALALSISCDALTDDAGQDTQAPDRPPLTGTPGTIPSSETGNEDPPEKKAKKKPAKKKGGAK
jgi:transcriptional regulator with XRE-family HTH domain